MEHELEDILASRWVPVDLIVTYDDMHGLWGGSLLTVRGDGWLEGQVRQRGAQAPTSSKTRVSQSDLLDLVRLLLELRTWEQRTPDAVPVPDESRAYLTINLKGNTGLVWERFNEMQANSRLIRIKRWMEHQLGDDPRNVTHE